MLFVYLEKKDTERQRKDNDTNYNPRKEVLEFRGAFNDFFFKFPISEPKNYLDHQRNVLRMDRCEWYTYVDSHSLYWKSEKGRRSGLGLRIWPVL